MVNQIIKFYSISRLEKRDKEKPKDYSFRLEYFLLSNFVKNKKDT